MTVMVIVIMPMMIKVMIVPIEVTLLGIVTVVNDVHKLNAA